ncbi:Magnesium and cobalt efflux protein CorC [Streptomyces sp. ADI95-16]|uniref:hemolysin family protein n=1 Tax=Streptomyces sp. ADI95-16 TaxID=1522758 RepID=UPI000F3A94AB|nr:hemolysin family protein [Streptomyces sp. ADI95-16]AYV25727.1 Magnesium and cobalt efflux protein CorC [Streptomyces sp. ADI95-16]
MTAIQLLIGLLTLVTNAFFVGAEFALISVRRSQIEPAAAKGNLRAKSTLWGLEHISAMMATAQLGITVSSLVLGAVAEPAIAHLLEPAFHAIGVPEGLIHPIAFVIALTVATYLHMLVGEMVPKNIALAAPAPTALLLGPPLVALTRALRPFVFGINAFANTLLRLLKVELKDEVGSVFTDDELARLVKDSSAAGLLAPEGGERLQDALELGKRPVGEIMAPLDRVVAVGNDITPRTLERTAAKHGYSRLPVTGPGEEILGYLHIKDALAAADRTAPFPRSALHPITKVSLDTPLDDTLTAMRAAGTHLAAVTGNQGTVIGFVTMEDLLEELVGAAAHDGDA